MTQKTVQCRLVANGETRQYFWHLMANIYTPFINEMLARIAQHQCFEEWNQSGKIPADIFKDLCRRLRSEPAFQGMPGRWYYAGCKLVKLIYKSWFARRSRLLNQLAGKTFWLGILQSDDDLEAACEQDLSAIQAEATAILARLLAEVPSNSGRSESSRQPRQTSQNAEEPQLSQNVFPALFEGYRTTETSLTRCAIAYLLKNNGRMPDNAENPEKFQRRRRKVEIRVERLTEQLARTRLPQGRDLTEEQRINLLKNARQFVPQDESEAAVWEAVLLREPSRLPFPITYEGGENLQWSVNSKGRLCVTFNGLSKLKLEIYCDNRQLHWFKRFLDDQTVKKQSGNQHSAGDFTLRSGRIIWQLGAGEGQPWDINRIMLHCSVDTRLWTKEGNEQVRQEKATKIAQVISGTRAKGNLTPQQQDFIRKREKTLALLENPFPRPSRPLYQGNPAILAGVSFGLDKPATLAIVDVTTGKAITYRSIRQLLGDNYKLLNRQRQRQHQKAQQRRSNQLRFAPNSISEGGLGDYIDSLIAKAIVQVAQQYNASSIALSNLANIREIIESEVQTKAEQQTALKEVQAKYARDYRASVHRWSYNRLSQKIESQALQAGLMVEQAKQPLVGTAQDKAREVAIQAFQARKQNSN